MFSKKEFNERWNDPELHLGANEKDVYELRVVLHSYIKNGGISVTQVIPDEIINDQTPDASEKLCKMAMEMTAFLYRRAMTKMEEKVTA